MEYPDLLVGTAQLLELSRPIPGLVELRGIEPLTSAVRLHLSLDLFDAAGSWVGWTPQLRASVKLKFQIAAYA